MSDSNQSRDKSYEAYVAFILGGLAIGSFVFQAYTFDSATTQRETALFNALQFLLTLGFGWFSTRSVSRIEFERSLKQFAIGAYRRIKDIESMIERLRERVQAGNSAIEGSAANLEVVAAALENTVQIVRSSTADWADVIGDELITLQKIDNLRREKTEIVISPELEESMRSTGERIAEINLKIQKLTEKLPADLQIDIGRSEDEQRDQEFRASWFGDQHKESGGLRLRVVAGGTWTCDGDVLALTNNSTLKIVVEKEGVNVRDASNVLLGRVLNNSPLGYREFADALRTCFGANAIDARFVEQIGERQDKDALIRWYVVKITAEPKPSTNPKRKKEDSKGARIRRAAN